MNDTRWPDFFIVGAPKSGTTSLYQYLRNTPGVYVSPTKEPHYFAPETAAKVKIERVCHSKQYLDLFKAAETNDIWGEASTAYLRAPEAPALIYKRSPHARIIIMLREPGSRAFSHYLMRWRSGGIINSFIDNLNTWDQTPDNISRLAIIEPGFYVEQIQRYLDTFGNEQVKIILFDDFVTDAEAVVSETLRFLGINASPPAESGTKYNDYQAPRGRLALSILRKQSLFRWLKPLIPAQLKWRLIRMFLHKNAEKPKMSSDERDILANIYQADVKALRLLLNKSALWKEHYPLN